MSLVMHNRKRSAESSELNTEHEPENQGEEFEHNEGSQSVRQTTSPYNSNSKK